METLWYQKYEVKKKEKNILELGNWRVLLHKMEAIALRKGSKEPGQNQGKARLAKKPDKSCL